MAKLHKSKFIIIYNKKSFFKSNISLFIIIFKLKFIFR